MAAASSELAQVTLEGYPREGSNVRGPVLYRGPLDTADSLDLAAPLAAGALLRKCAGRPTIYVQGKFELASLNATILVVFYAQAGTTFGAYVGHTRATLVASADELDGALFLAQPIPFDALAENYEVRLKTPPAGPSEVSLYTWEV